MIFVPRKNIYTLKGPKWQRGSVSMSAFANAAQQGAGGGGLDTTVTVGSGVYDSVQTSTTGSIDYFAFGYASGVDRLSLSNFGSIGTATYTDGGSNSRTVSGIYYTEVGGSASQDDNLYLSLNATSIPNTAATFVSIDYNGTNYLRTAATYSGTLGSCSSWQWTNINPNGPTSGTPAFKVNI